MFTKHKSIGIYSENNLEDRIPKTGLKASTEPSTALEELRKFLATQHGQVDYAFSGMPNYFTINEHVEINPCKSENTIAIYGKKRFDARKIPDIKIPVKKTIHYVSDDENFWLIIPPQDDEIRNIHYFYAPQ